jgi:hypothetical protein
MELLTERRWSAFDRGAGRGGVPSCGMRGESSSPSSGAVAAVSGLTAGAAAAVVVGGSTAEAGENKSAGAVVSATRGLFGIVGATGMSGTAGDGEAKEAGGGEYREPKVVDLLRGLAEGERGGF